MSHIQNLHYNEEATKANKKSRSRRFVLFLFASIFLIGLSVLVVWTQVDTALKMSSAAQGHEAPQEDIDAILQHMNTQYSKHFTYVEGTGSQSGAYYVYTSIRCRDDEGTECQASSALNTSETNSTLKFEDDYQVIYVNKVGTEIVKNLMPNISNASYNASYMGKTDATTRYYTDPGQVFDDRNYDVCISAHLDKSSNTEDFCKKLLEKWPNTYARVFVTGEDENGYTLCNIDYKVENGRYFITNEKWYDNSDSPVFSPKPPTYQ